METFLKLCRTAKGLGELNYKCIHFYLNAKPDPMSIHNNLYEMTEVAMYYAEVHNTNYNIIRHNESSYEMVMDSYFEKDRPHCRILTDTDTMLSESRKAEALEDMLVNNEYAGDIWNEFIKITDESSHYYMDDYFGHNGPTATHPIRTEPKIMRNSPCPCNSGKKYKKYCIN